MPTLEIKSLQHPNPPSGPKPSLARARLATPAYTRFGRAPTGATERTILNLSSKGYLLIHLCVLLFGFTPLMGRLITLDAIPVVWWRMALAALALLLLPATWSGLRRMPARLGGGLCRGRRGAGDHLDAVLPGREAGQRVGRRHLPGHGGNPEGQGPCRTPDDGAFPDLACW